MKRKITNLLLGILMIFVSSLINLFPLISNDLIINKKFSEENANLFLTVMSISFSMPIYIIISFKFLTINKANFFSGFGLAVVYFIIFLDLNDILIIRNFFFIFMACSFLVGQFSYALFIIPIYSNLNFFRIKNCSTILCLLLAINSNSLNGLVYKYINNNDEIINSIFQKFYILPIFIFIITLIFSFNYPSQEVFDLYSNEKNQKNYEIFKEKKILKIFFIINTLIFLAYSIMNVYVSINNINFIYSFLVGFLFLFFNIFIYILENSKVLDKILSKKFLAYKLYKRNILLFDNLIRNECYDNLLLTKNRNLLLDYQTADYGEKGFLEPIKINIDKNHLNSIKDENVEVNNLVIKKEELISNFKTSYNNNYVKKDVDHKLNSMRIPVEPASQDLKDFIEEPKHQESSEKINIINKYKIPVGESKNYPNLELLSNYDLNYNDEPFIVNYKENYLNEKVINNENGIPENDLADINFSGNEICIIKNDLKFKNLRKSYVTVNNVDNHNMSIHDIDELENNKDVKIDSEKCQVKSLILNKNSIKENDEALPVACNYPRSSNSSLAIINEKSHSHISKIYYIDEAPSFYSKNVNKTNIYSTFTAHHISMATMATDYNYPEFYKVVLSRSFILLISNFIISKAISDVTMNKYDKILFSLNLIKIFDTDSDSDIIRPNAKKEIFEISFLYFFALNVSLLGFYHLKNFIIKRQTKTKITIIPIISSSFGLIAKILMLINNFIVFKVAFTFLSISSSLNLVFTLFYLRLKFGLKNLISLISLGITISLVLHCIFKFVFYNEYFIIGTKLSSHEIDYSYCYNTQFFSCFRISFLFSIGLFIFNIVLAVLQNKNHAIEEENFYTVNLRDSCN